MNLDPSRVPAPLSFLGVPVERHARLGSTNDEAFRRARGGAPHGLVVVAEEQSEGRGRYGRPWFGSRGESLLFSVLLRPTLPLPSYPLLALALACSVADAGAEAIGGRPALEIKWPNDVLHRGRKLCGVLAESRVVAQPVLVIGAGVNVNQSAEAFPGEIRAAATSLRIAAGGRAVAIPELLEGTLARFEPYVALAGHGDPHPLFERLRPRLPAAGSSVRVRLGDRSVEGSVEEVLESGALRVRDRVSGALETIAAGVLE